MFSFLKSPPPPESDAAYRELRRTMQDIVLAHATICFKHLTQEQLVAVQAEWARVVRGRGWTPFFVDDGPPAPAPHIECATERATPGDSSNGPHSAACAGTTSSLLTRTE